MSKNYDNWEKLVEAVLKREKLKQLALSHSMDSTTISDQSSCFSFSSSCVFDHQLLPQDHRETVVTGKLLFLPVEARELTIRTEHFPEGHLPYSGSFDEEVVEVDSSVLSLDIRGRIKTHLLSPKTIYGAYLVFKAFFDVTIGFESATAMIVTVKDGIEAVVEKFIKGEMAVRRADGWMDVQLGMFYADEEEGDSQVEASFKKISRMKTGLLILGIEFRPLVNVRQV